MPALITLLDVTVRWPAEPGLPARTALKRVSLEVAAGELVGVVGAAGSGGATLVRALNGVVPQLIPAEVTGRLEVCGLDAVRTPVAEMARVVSLVTDDPEAQMTQLTVDAEVAFGLENQGLPLDEMRARVAEVLALVGLDALAARNPLTLSGGEQQRLVVACAIASRPRVLALDEPTANLDGPAGRRVLELARGLASGPDGVAVVIASHNVDLLAEYADRIVWLRDGRMVLDGDPSAVFTAMAHERAQERVNPGPPAATPAVTELCARLDPGSQALPVTVAGTVEWLAGRG
ncbi:MAG: ABC transporter ATP-binding protein [Candidatus Limnocylindrales bacterium]